MVAVIVHRPNSLQEQRSRSSIRYYTGETNTMSGSDLSDDEESAAPQAVNRIQNGPPQTSTSELAAGISRWMEASKSFLYVELASLVLLFACVFDWYPTVWHKYALSVACISLLICLILQTTECLIPGFLEWVIIEKRDDGSGGHSVQKMCSVFLLVWWLVGTGIITFHCKLFIYLGYATSQYLFWYLQ